MIDFNTPVNKLLVKEKIPRMVRVRQLFDCQSIKSIDMETRKTLNRPEIVKTIVPGMKIAITAGSRGVANIDVIIKQIVDFIKLNGGIPFIIPAMGSHGGAVAEGQVGILQKYGITEETMGAPIRATMEVVKIGEMDGSPIYIDRYAAEADGIVVVNRIKPHTAFRGKYESGLFKMMVIGLGKQFGAELAHGRGAREMGNTIAVYGKTILNTAKILFGVAILENAMDETSEIVGLTQKEIEEKEPLLLDKARFFMPRILFENLDVLIVDRIGKNISGSGMDCNITHSYLSESGISRAGRAKRIAVLDITPESFGSGLGMGYADTTTRRFFDKIDFNTTYPNCLTAGAAEPARIPMVLDSQELAIKACIKTALGANKEKLRMVRIRDTLNLHEISISESLLAEAKSNSHIEIIDELSELIFNDDGNLF